MNNQPSNVDEVWKDVVGYEGRYEVSNLGNVRSILGGRRLGTVLRQAPVDVGYYRVSLCDTRGIRHKRVHRLVAEAFIENPDNKPCVNHLDGVIDNNNLTNLEWCTYSENMKHSFEVLGRKVNQKLTREEMESIYSRWKSGETRRAISKSYDVHEGTIGKIIYKMGKEKLS